jgi:predicted phosphoribosyltransferase
MTDLFADRKEAGKILAAELSAYKNRDDVIVLGLPRGGVPVAFEVARELDAPLDIFLVRKLGVPWMEELAFGAIASGGTTVYNEALLPSLGLSEATIQEVIERQKKELERRENLYRADHPALDLTDKTVIIVDDGLATGATMRAAIAAVRSRNPKQIIAAAPVASRPTCEMIDSQTDNLCICSMKPVHFFAIGDWYRNFNQTTDEEVTEILDASRRKEANYQTT